MKGYPRPGRSIISLLSVTTTAALLWVPRACAEIRSIEGPIEAAASFIHYSEGFVASPGYVDVGGLTFSTLDNEDTEHTKPSQLEVVLFNEPQSCAKAGQECDWASLGIGGEDSNGDLRWCCWEDSIEMGMCSGKPEEYGKMIIDKSKFTGQYRSLTIPATGHQDLQMKLGKMDVKGPSGKYILLMANCDVSGRDLEASGKYIWMSEHGYLPGDLFGEMYYYVFMTILYAVLFTLYGYYMKVHEESRIPIQNYVILTVGIGFAEVFFRAGDYWVWNEDGTRFWFAMYTGIFAGVVKRSISRCLMVMVSLGWGVVLDDLRTNLKKIYLLGSLYFGFSLLTDVLKVFSIVENEVLGASTEEELFDIVAICTFVIAALDVYFYMWILDSLSGTMKYLEEMAQKRKLDRYLKLRLVFLLSVLFSVVCLVFMMVNTYLEAGILPEKHQWGQEAAWELNYFAVLSAVAFLWKPDPHAKEYAYVMELPSMAGDDLKFSTNDGIVGEDDDHDDEEDAIDNRLDGEEDDMKAH